MQTTHEWSATSVDQRHNTDQRARMQIRRKAQLTEKIKMKLAPSVHLLAKFANILHIGPFSFNIG